MDLLARRDYSRRELSNKLSKRLDQEEMGLEDLLNAVLDDLQERQWQSDERFAESYIRHRSHSGIGPLRLHQELQSKGVSAQVIEHILQNSELDWNDIATQVAQKKLRSLRETDPQRQQKLYRFMQYRGFLAEHFQSASFERLDH